MSSTKRGAGPIGFSALILAPSALVPLTPLTLFRTYVTHSPAAAGSGANSDTGSLEVVITDAESGQPVTGVGIILSGPTPGDARTDDAGRFLYDELEPGTYRLAAGNYVAGLPSVYAREWWDDAADYDSADPVSVTAGEVTVLEWPLRRGGIITGTVTDDATGSPVPNVEVGWVVRNPDGSREGPNGGFTTDGEGNYSIPGLHTADYFVCFHAVGYVRECWNDRANPPGGVGIEVDPIRVEVGETVVGVNASLAGPAPPTTSTSPVTDPPTTITQPGPNSTPDLPTAGQPGSPVRLLALAAALLLGGAALAVAASARSSATTH